jgi:hypothetical protein
VYVSDREKVVAELHEPGTVYATDEDPNPVLAAWLSAGIVTLPKRPMNEAEIRMTSALTIVEAERANWTTMSLTPGVLTRAGRAFPIEPVRTLEAIHLAPA